VPGLWVGGCVAAWWVPGAGTLDSGAMWNMGAGGWVQIMNNMQLSGLLGAVPGAGGGYLQIHAPAVLPNQITWRLGGVPAVPGRWRLLGVRDGGWYLPFHWADGLPAATQTGGSGPVMPLLLGCHFWALF